MARAQGRLLSASICELSSREDMIGRRHSAWVSQAVFSDKDKPDKALQVVFFGLVLRVWGFFFVVFVFWVSPVGGSETKLNLLVAQVGGMWRAWGLVELDTDRVFPRSCFLCSPFVLGSACSLQ